MKPVDYSLPILFTRSIPGSISRYCHAIIIISGLLLISACNQKQEQQVRLAAVTVATAQKETIKPSIEFVGRAESTDDIKIRSRVAGVLTNRYFKQGQDIEKGAKLFEIDPAPFKAALNAEQAKFDKAKADLTIAKRNFKRGKELVKDNVISQLDMDKLTNQFEVAKSSIQQAQAGVETAKLNLGYTIIKAPLSGRIGKSLFALGDVINPSADTLTTLVKMDPMYVSFQVSEKAMVTFYQEVIKQKEAKHVDKSTYIVELRLSNGSRYPQQGNIDYLSNRIDPATGTMNLRALFSNPDSLLLPGQYLDVIIMAKKETSAILIPQSAVQEDQQGKFVMTVAENNKVAKTRVTMGNQYDLKWEVASGLKVGDRVIVEGLQKVRAGAEVTTTEQKIKPFENVEKISENNKVEASENKIKSE